MALKSIPIRSDDPPPDGPTYDPDRGGWYPPEIEPQPDAQPTPAAAAANGG